MDAERLFKISRNNVPAGRRSPGRPKRRWRDIIFDYNRQNRLQKIKIRRRYGEIAFSNVTEGELMKVKEFGRRQRTLLLDDL
jgi:hypothetical protein